MRATFHRNGKKGKKWQKCLKFGQKSTKFENVLEKGSLMRATIACMKQLEYALNIEVNVSFRHLTEIDFDEEDDGINLLLLVASGVAILN